MTVRVAELESVFTASVEAFEKAAVKVETRRKNLGKTPVDLKVGADTKGAEAGTARVEADAKRLTSKDVVARIDANITAAQKKAASIRGDLAVLDAMDVTPEVTADIAKAQAALTRTEAQLKALQGARAKVEVEADTSKAESALSGVADKAGSAGSKAGEEAGSNLAGGIVAAIATIPVAGAVIGIGATIGKALLDGLQVEVRSDLLTARTGLDEATVARVARVAGEAYADNFGESIASNMDTARVAIQGGLLDPDATARDAKRVVESLDGVATILGEDIPRVSRSTAQLLRTGLAKDAAGAFDIIVKGQQAGLNVSEDWLDTIDEYSTKFRDLGLEGPQAVGLLSQAVRAGARDTDVAADALKEFTIRAVDGSTTTVDGFKRIGLNADEMAEKIAAGGPTAAAGLQQVLEGLRGIEDPAARSYAAVELFGTKAEDMGQSLYAMDLSNAVDQLGQVEGAAKSAVDALGDNTAGSIESAQRNIEVAADGIKGALAAAFAPQIEGAATFVSENREAVMQFLLDMANGALDAGRALVTAAAAGTEGFGHLVNTAGPALLGMVGAVIDAQVKVAEMLDPTGILGLKDAAHDARDSFRDMRDSAEKDFAAFEDTTAGAADWMRTTLIEGAIDPAQEKLNDIAIPMVAQAALHDASMQMAQDLDTIGESVDMTVVSLDNLTGRIDTGTEAGRTLDEQIRAMVDSLNAEAAAGVAAGLSQDELNQQVTEGRDALLQQLVQMGYTVEQAGAIADAYGAIPARISTEVTADTSQADQALLVLQQKITGLTGADQRGAITDLRYAAQAASAVKKGVGYGVNVRYEAAGDILTKGATGMSPIAQVVPPGTLRVVGDSPWDESFIPLNSSPRSMALLAETAHRLGHRIMPLASGAVLGSSQAASRPSLAGLSIEGSLDLGDGIVGMLRGVVVGELAAQARSQAGTRTTVGVVR